VVLLKPLVALLAMALALA